MDERYYDEFAACFVRGVRPDLPLGLDDAAVREWGATHGLRLHRFKRKMPLPRVERVLGVLRQFQPARLVDVGSGRGTFLWPLLDRFPNLEVTCVEADPDRAELLAAVRAGGLSRLRVVGGGMEGFEAGRVGPADITTVLEVLEHVDDPAPVARACVAAATTAVIASVPSTPDDNPGHVRLFDRTSLTRLLRDAGARRVTIDQVPNHLVAVATGLEA